MHPIQDLFLEGFSYVLQIDMHFICTLLWTKFYSCKKWVLQFLPMSFLVDFHHDVLQMTQWLYLISDDTSERWLISSKIKPIIMLLVVVNDQKKSWLVTPWVEALPWTKTIAGVHVLIGHGVIATHMACLTSRSISLQLYGEDSCEKSVLLVE
jgi:hypothetical protein